MISFRDCPNNGPVYKRGLLFLKEPSVIVAYVTIASNVVSVRIWKLAKQLRETMSIDVRIRNDDCLSRIVPEALC